MPFLLCNVVGGNIINEGVHAKHAIWTLPTEQQQRRGLSTVWSKLSPLIASMLFLSAQRVMELNGRAQ